MDSTDTQYRQRLKRYVTAMRNEKPDMIPLRPFIAEFATRYAGYGNQESTHDYELIFKAFQKCAADFDWDAIVPNLIYNYAGVIKAIGWNSFAFPGIELDVDSVVQYMEPPEDKAYMQPEEYDRLIDDPTAFLFEVWLPRYTDHICAPGEASSFEQTVALLNGGMAMMDYNMANVRNAVQMQTEKGTVAAISGLLKAPLDILSDKLRGYVGLSMDLLERPDKVLKACEALMPHLIKFALAGADPEHYRPITIWMHRGCVPFVSPRHFDGVYWPTLKPIVEEIWSRGHQVLFYAEGDWKHHLKAFAELPEKSIVFHADRTDIFKAHEALGHKFCISGGLPNHLLSMGTPEEVRQYCKRIIDGVAKDGGYIMDASAIIQDDAKAENLLAMTEFTRENGVYSQATSAELPPPFAPSDLGRTSLLDSNPLRRKPGVCIPWDDKKEEFGTLKGDEALTRQMWERHDASAYYFIWQSFLW